MTAMLPEPPLIVQGTSHINAMKQCIYLVRQAFPQCTNSNRSLRYGGYHLSTASSCRVYSATIDEIICDIGHRVGTLHVLEISLSIKAAKHHWTLNSLWKKDEINVEKFNTWRILLAIASKPDFHVFVHSRWSLFTKRSNHLIPRVPFPSLHTSGKLHVTRASERKSARAVTRLE